MAQYKLSRQKHKQTPHRYALIIILLISLMVALSACQPKQTVTESRLKLAGSTSVEPIARQLAESFTINHPEVDISVRGGGSTIGVQGIAYGALQIGMSSREIQESELAEFPSLTPTVIARDGVAVVINPTLYAAGVTHLTIDEVAAIWDGEITNWQEVGGPDMAILVFDRELGSGTQFTFAELVLGGDEAQSPVAFGVVSESVDVIAAISENENGISILSFGWLDENVAGLSIVDSDGKVVPPTTENLVNGEYPISRNLNLITNGNPDGLAAQFIEFALSPEGQSLVAEQGYTPVTQ